MQWRQPTTGNRRHIQNADSNSGPSGNNLSQGGSGTNKEKAEVECWYCGWKGHDENECWKKGNDSNKVGSSRNDADRHHRLHFAVGSKKAKSGPTLVMNHKANRMGVSDSKLEEVWYMECGVSNHMTNYKEWFSFLKKPEQLGVLETGHIRCPSEPCWPNRKHEEHPTCFDDHKELGVDRLDCGSRYASQMDPPQKLYRGGRSIHRIRTLGWKNVHPRDQ